MADNKEKNEHFDEESTKANEAIQEQFYDEDEKPEETSSPVPFVANNTAPLTSKNDNKKK